MCGIFGYVGRSTDAARIVLEGLKRLEYRGYDSWGIAVPRGGRASVERYTGKIGEAETRLPPTGIALGHTRWATHGGVNRRNAHPHLDCHRRLAVIHNGIVENHDALRTVLIEQGHRFRSTTDTEVIAHLIEQERDSGATLMEAAFAAFRRLHGLNAIAVLDVVEGTVLAVKSGSPLVLGWAEGSHLLASDAAALLSHTRCVTYMSDGQAARIARDGIKLFDVGSGQELAPAKETVDWADADDSRGGHAHYMAKEIREQPEVLDRLAVANGALDDLSGAIADAGSVLLTGCGSAYHAALAGAYALARVAGRQAHAVPASELPHRLGPGTSPVPLDPGRGQPWLVAVSQSGETIDVLDAVRAARAHGMRVAAITNVQGSSLYRMADLPVLIGAGPERAVLATKTFTAQVAALTLAAHRIVGRRREGRDAVERAAGACRSVIAGQEAILEVAYRMRDARTVLVLGRGLSFPAAIEAALKIKEVSYIHAEGFAAGELKHGVIALVESGTPCLILAPRDDTFAAVASSAMEVKARGAITFGLSSMEDPAFDKRLDVPECGVLTMLAQTVAVQILAYHLALLRGCDPDKPRNLAKCVTVR